VDRADEPHGPLGILAVKLPLTLRAALSAALVTESVVDPDVGGVDLTRRRRWRAQSREISARRQGPGLLSGRPLGAHALQEISAVVGGACDGDLLQSDGGLEAVQQILVGSHLTSCSDTELRA